ncbi:MAG TPA: hypothetical protein VEQ41_01520, partial [Solirubrobacterales bacterium]|nr:hypothetical protein [Solirubrobacterales bacterium]
MARPINADLPKANPGDVPAESAGARRKTSPEGTSPRSVARRARRRRQPVPAALKAIAALFVLAVVFIVAAILGGGSSEDGSPAGPAPAPLQGGEPQTDEAPANAAELGFPAFATSNTTRVGGADPASNAAGVALAVYPSTDEALRPAAVTLVPADDWQAG